MSKKESSVNWFVVVLIIFLFIIVYLATFGQVNINVENNKVIKDSAEVLSKLKIRHQKLKALIDKKEQLSKKLKLRFRLAYISVRLLFVGIFVSYNGILYYGYGLKELGVLLNWNELALIGVTLISFISFGSLASLKDFLDNVRMKLEVWVYSKKVFIDDDIQTHKVEVKQIALNISNTKH